MSTPLLSWLSLTGALLFQEPAASEPEAAAAEPERGLIHRGAGAMPGYTLFSPLLSATTYLIDLDGQVVHQWRAAHAPGNADLLLDNGHLLRCARLEDNPRFYGGGIGGRIQEFDWDGNVVWDFTFSDDRRMHHHDFERLPNGNLLLIAWEHRTPEQAIAAGRDPRAVGDEGLWPDALYEIEPQPPDGGRIVWEWHVWDHLVQDFDPRQENYAIVPEHPELLDVNADHRDQPAPTAEQLRAQAEQEARMRELGYVGGDEPEEEPDERDARRRSNPDWLHTNAVHYDPERDLIVISSPRMDEIYVIDHSTTSAEAASHRGGRYGKGGDFLYRWGHPRRYGAGGDADQRLFAQHDARFLTAGLPGAGRILVFNNGQDRPGADFSSVDELELPFDPKTGFARAAGAAFGPAEPAWSYRAEGFYSSFISGAQRLANGNTLVCSGEDGRMIEVTAAGEVVWEYHNPFGGDVPPSFGRAGAPPPPPGDGAAPPRRSGIRPIALFRATRLPADHPGLARLSGPR